jgi:hypothetical protein
MTHLPSNYYYLLESDFWIKIQIKQLLDKKKNVLFKKLKLRQNVVVTQFKI